MKKIFTYYCLIMVNILVLGQAPQGKYIIESHIKIKPANSTFGDGCSNSVSIDLIFNNTTKRILDEDLNNIPTRSAL